MSGACDETHDPSRESWVESANDPATDFPLQNLPFGRFRPVGEHDFRIGVAIGDEVLDLARAGLVASDDMNALMAAGAEARRALRLELSCGLRRGSAQEPTWREALHPQADVEMGLPCRIGDYTDFYTSIHHATAVGRLFRPDNPLLPNYKWVPIGYHGRCSSIVVSGQRIVRPRGQLRGPDDAAPVLAPTRRLDYEVELGALIGAGNPLGEPISIEQAEEHLFGLVLLNDWSARDIQAWEYQPLGPFLAKNFATTVSPWIVTLEALQPFRVPFVRPSDDPAPLPYLDSAVNRESGAFDIVIEAWLHTAAMQANGHPPERLSRANYRDAAYWTLVQLVAHHTVNGCNLQPGDLLGTGTLSGPVADQAGSMLELSGGGKRGIALADGKTRTFLEDGDAVILRGSCKRDGMRRVGFGECVGIVLPADQSAE